MFNMVFENNVNVLWDNDLFKSVVEMTMEHYVPVIKYAAIFINVNAADFDIVNQYKQDHPEQKIILYNLEHKYPLIAPRKVECCTDYWSSLFERFITLIDEVWDYNIENYLYFESIGYGSKFKFIPLRYTSWFNQFIHKVPKIYDIEFEGAFDTEIRLECIRKLTTPGTYGSMIKFKLANVQDQAIKFFEKQDSLFCLDMPHYNFPETINALRIFENLCLNQPTLVFDIYQVGSRKYFEDMVMYVDELTQEAILKIVESGVPENVADKFKSLTYNDSDFETYKFSILEDFKRISGEIIPNNII